MPRPFLVCLAPLILTSCGEGGGGKNPPTEPADAVVANAPVQASGDQTGSTASMLPGAGAPSFIGRWANDVSWCVNDGAATDRVPIQITTTRFEGYENGCDIVRISEEAASYVALLRCQSQGAVREERVRLTAAGDRLSILYLDRGGPAVDLNKCTTLAETSTRSPVPTP